MDWDQDTPRRQPRIVARGAWSQDEYGDTTYYPENCRPEVFPPHDDAGDAPGNGLTGWGDLDHGIERNMSPDEAARATGQRGGYAIRSGDVWDQARAVYLAGDSARTVCERYLIKRATFRDRAQREGWRRQDQPDPDPVETHASDTQSFDMEAALAGPAPDPADMAARALIHARRAIDAGRASEAASWLRSHRQLTRMIAEAAQSERGQADQAPPEPDPLDLITLKMKAVGEVAKAATGLSEDNAAGHAAITGLIEMLRTMPMGRPTPAAEPPVSDHSDHSDPVFFVAGDEAPSDDPGSSPDGGPSPAAGTGDTAFPRFYRPDSCIVDPVARPDLVAAPPQSPAGPMALSPS